MTPTWLRAVALSMLMFAASLAHAETYPEHPVKIVVPYPPGGGTDAFARFLAEQLSLRGAHRFLVENIAGANGGIGTAAVAGARPDGYTLLIASPGTLLVNPQIYRGARYQLASFEPVIALSNFTNLVVVSPRLGVTTAADLVALAKRQPGKLNFGSSGHGNLGHFAGEMFKASTGIDIVHVPYKGGNEAMMGLLGGSIDILFPSVNEAQTHIASGGVKAVGVMSDRRTPLLPDIPTLREQGIHNAELASWNGIVAPAGTPAAVVNWLNEALNEILRSPAGIETMTRFGTTPIGGSVADFKTRLATENKLWTGLIATAGIEKAN
jgi:tripartite-type tricarboxylate transporter receptor subunit TctC